MIIWLQRWLTTPLDKAPKGTYRFWFGLSLACALAIALVALRKALTNPFLLQDDVRQHVFWMARFQDPNLFPNDLIADYFQSVAPWGYKALYWLLSAIGVEPLFASKLIPIPLALLTAAYSFGVCVQILPVPFAGWLAALLLNENLMRSDDLYSATPRAFVYPLFLAILYYWQRRSLWPYLIAIALLGLFYPQVLLIACVALLLSLGRWQGGKLGWNRDRAEWGWVGAGLATAAIAMLVYTLQQDTAQFGSAFWAAEARKLPEFWGQGRLSFFQDNAFAFWFTDRRSSFLARPERLFVPSLMVVGLLLPVCRRGSQRWPLAQQLTDTVRVLGLTVAASTLLYFVAHLLLFKLHLPSRYTQHTFRLVLAIAAAITLTIWLDALFRWAMPAARSANRSRIALAITGLLAIVLLINPIIVPPTPGFKPGRAQELYAFLASQPKDSLIASIAQQADFVPTFARRSVLASQETGIVYHKGYYTQYRQRMLDLIQAQYSPDRDVLRRFNQQYGIDFWLVDEAAFKRKYLLDKPWMQQQYGTVVDAALTQLQSETAPALKQARQRCTVFRGNDVRVLDAQCLNRTPPASGNSN